jgi:hypothetical protein
MHPLNSGVGKYHLSSHGNNIAIVAQSGASWRILFSGISSLGFPAFTGSGHNADTYYMDDFNNTFAGENATVIYEGSLPWAYGYNRHPRSAFADSHSRTYGLIRASYCQMRGNALLVPSEMSVAPHEHNDYYGYERYIGYFDGVMFLNIRDNLSTGDIIKYGNDEYVVVRIDYNVSASDAFRGVAFRK